MISDEVRAAAAAAYRAGRAADALALLEPHCRQAGEGGDWLTLGRLKQHLGDLEGALAALEVAAQTPATQVVARRLAAQWLLANHDVEAACVQLERGLAAAPDNAELWGALAAIQDMAGHAGAALASYAHALRLAPDAADCRLNRAALLRGLGHFERALPDYAWLVAHHPSEILYWTEQAECLRQCRRTDECIASCEQALALDANSVAAHMCKAVALASVGEVERAQQCFNRAFADDAPRAARYGHAGAPLPAVPDARSVYFAAAFSRLTEADWRGYGDLLSAALDFFATPSRAPSDLSGAFPLLYLPLPNALRSAGHIAISNAIDCVSLPPPARRDDDGRRLRVAYLSCKFKDHPGMVLTGGLFRAHDRGRFEVYGYAINRDDDSPQRRYVRNEFDHFIDLSALDDEAAARRIRADDIDILVDLNGYSDEARPRIMAARPARLQFAYLGHSHSLFASWLDYRVSDRVSEPDDWGHPCAKRAPSCRRASIPMTPPATHRAPRRREPRSACRTAPSYCAASRAWKKSNRACSSAGWICCSPCRMRCCGWGRRQAPRWRHCAHAPCNGAWRRSAWYSSSAWPMTRISPAIAPPTCSWIPGPSTPTPPVSMPCRPGCRW
ncbi:MAG: hypothetical protein IPG43_08815 [Proteobacteria bacterium]|nr:hypothetical protein [Pseudomonadota bacterium]